MAAPPRFPTLRETDLAIKDGPVDGAALRDVFKRLFGQLGPSLDRLNAVTSKGITPGENIRCDLMTVKATHGVPFTVKLQTLQRASSCMVTGGDTLLPYPLATVQMLQPSQTGGGNAASVTVFFQGGTGTANVRLQLFEDGLQATRALTFNAQEAWTAPALLNSYAVGGGRTVGYFRDSLGLVHLRGTVTGGVADTIFTLPAGYRPSQLWIFSTDHNGAFGRVLVNTTGDVQSDLGLHTNVVLDGIIFDTR